MLTTSMQYYNNIKEYIFLLVLIKLYKPCKINEKYCVTFLRIVNLWKAKFDRIVSRNVDIIMYDFFIFLYERVSANSWNVFWFFWGVQH